MSRTVAKAITQQGLSHRHRPAFAVVIALAIISLILTLITSLAWLSRTELQRSKAGNATMLARAHAKFGLGMAINQLQTLAGQDTCATYRGDFHIDCDPSARLWTGVLQVAPNGQHRNLGWLVSGDLVPQQGASDVVMAGNATLGTAHSHVFANRVAIGEHGHYAYWVSDEGLKTSLSKTHALEDLREQLSRNGQASTDAELAQLYGLNTDQFRRFAQGIAWRPRNEMLFSRNMDFNHAAVRNLIRHVYSSADFAKSSLFQNGEHQPMFASATGLHLGVLSHPHPQGLKRDLSDATLLDAGAPIPLNAKLQAFLLPPANHSNSVPLRGLAMPVSPEPEQLATVIAPLITEFELRVGVFRTSEESATRSHDNLKVEVALRMDLWNPYASPLAANDTDADVLDPNDFRVHIEGLPALTIDWTTAHRDPLRQRRGQLVVDLNSAFLEHRYLPKVARIADGIPVDIEADFAPGEVKYINDYYRYFVPLPHGRIPNYGDKSDTRDDPIRVRLPPASLAISVTSPDANTLYQTIDDIAYWRADNLFEGETYELHGLANPGYPDYHVAYHFRLNESDLFLADPPELDPLTSPLHTDPRLLSGLEQHMHVYDPNPIAAAVKNQGFPRFDTEYLFGGLGSYAAPHHIAWFDLPRRPVTSLGFLQHMAQSNEPPAAIGNPWGQGMNAVFDRYFISGLPAHRMPAQPLWNPHLQLSDATVIDPHDGDLSAAAYLLRGAFNINATSVDAWCAQLASLSLSNWERSDGSMTTMPVKAAAYRFSHSADDTLNHPHHQFGKPTHQLTQSDKINWLNPYTEDQPVWLHAYSSGVRELRSSTADHDDVRDLATAIVNALRQRNLPFASLQEFINDGILQRAINQTYINTLADRPYEQETRARYRIPRTSPNFLTQADLLQVLAPLLTARSDTFVVRAYGEALDPLTRQVLARSWCEAVVQRTSEPFISDPAQDRISAYRAPPTPFGRQFRILSFRWLDASEI